MTIPIKTLDVKPRLPEPLLALQALAGNLWFFWHHDAHALFRRINPELWEETQMNPVAFLIGLKQRELKSLSRDEGFLTQLERVKADFDRYQSERPNPKVFGKSKEPFLVAYFTAECGLADCLPIYSGGLGMLAGDHLKSASDLNLPIVGVSLAYKKGYFRQYLTKDGWQMETYPVSRFSTMPMRRVVREGEKDPIQITLDLKGDTVAVQAWKVHIGRTVLFLLDTNVKDNPDWARNITSELYGGDQDMRIHQEIVLGIGGVRMLRAVGLDPAVFHMNEGHSAFAAFERIREFRELHGLSFDEALEIVRMTNLFTTHTPVSAGIDTFSPDLMRPYFDPLAKSMGISIDVLLGFGRQDPRDRTEQFSMAVLALRTSARSNGVSRLHGKVSRKMWGKIWPKTAEIDIPITHVTNGVHIPSWISQAMEENYNRYLGPHWIEDPDNVKAWERVATIPDTELWRTHERAKSRLIGFVRKRLRSQLTEKGVAERDVAVADEVLNFEALTIGFARRFAPYKRADILLKDIDRLKKILTNRVQPVQLIFAGKAHPQDQSGKELIKRIVDVCNREDLRRHMVFLEDYDMEIARYMVQGVDVWLNTPRRPYEACGTSGMKAVANGALHLSVLDGWWDEGFDGHIGWAIGAGEVYEDHVLQDSLEGRALYDILEKDVIPLFYERGAEGLPRRWLGMMKGSLHRLCPLFNTHRMVEDYWDRFYLPAAETGADLMQEGMKNLKSLTEWRNRIMFGWNKVAILDIQTADVVEIESGSEFPVEVKVSLGELLPEDVIVEAYCGRLDPEDRFVDRFIKRMELMEDLGNGLFQYGADVLFQESGHFGLNVRVTPNHPHPESRHGLGLVVWGQP